MDQIQLLTARMSVNSIINKFVEEQGVETLEKMGDDLADRYSEMLPEDPAKLKQCIAEYQGITVKDLIDSPNYSVFKDEYETMVSNLVIEDLMKQFGFNNLEARIFITMCKEED